MSDLIGTHLLQGIDVLDSELIAVQLWTKTLERIVQVDRSPFPYVRDGTI